ncbi:hypothetical protein BD324DRAFT_635793 [Kockovaella imperatae]|uniref:DUF21-domain-containing protein n=1 Tax=Kockovaella imperatae TaxID=4999 RepID=A0A1Y1UA82_9TREE|nr:hypothetical protein BD324DRAFT_635793 [Kockovaella imperatae]ORX34416.1 hypothetical protein BD324DRAFT_635793 [Kockovaella imperatae]
MDLLTNGIVNIASKKAEKHVHVSPEDPRFLWYILVIVVLVLLGGVFSGLTLGLMGLDTVNLQVLQQAGTDDEKLQAPKVLRLLRTGRHTILVVLLLGNTLVNTSLPIFIDSLVGGGLIAVLGSTALELIFGGILPQSICNRYGLAIGATFAPAVRILVILMYPIAKPIGMLLDRFLGAAEESITYRKAELKTFVSLGVEDKLGEDEVSLLGSVLEFSGKTVEEIMTPFEDVFALSAEKIMDDEIISEILRKGYSRIPIYEPSSPGAFIGCLTLRALVGYDSSDLKPASALVTQPLPQCPPDLPLLEAMAYFQAGRSHILLVSETPGKDTGAVGVVTLEDVVEELIGREIIDETDQYIDIHSRVKVIRRKDKGEQ